MNRASFIKNIAVLIAAPKILVSLPESIKKGVIREHKTKGEYFFKISKEMQDDINYTSHLFSNKNSFLWKDCLQQGIDLSKRFDFKLGYVGDDFERNLLTGVISQ